MTKRRLRMTKGGLGMREREVLRPYGLRTTGKERPQGDPLCVILRGISPEGSKEVLRPCGRRMREEGI